MGILVCDAYEYCVVFVMTFLAYFDRITLNLIISVDICYFAELEIEIVDV